MSPDPLAVTAVAQAPTGGPARRLARTAEAAWLGSYWLVLAALSRLFPFNGDDWGWGSAAGLRRMHDWFSHYNGRYAGDMLVIGLTRAPWLASAVLAAVVVASLWLILDLTGHRTPGGYVAVAIGFLVMPPGQWAQAVAWLSGFCNYGLAAFVVLLFCWWAKRAWLGRLEGSTTRRCVVILPVAIVSALFVENVTLYLIVAALVVGAALWRRRRVTRPDSLAWLSGYVAGAVWMFSNNSYRAIAHNHAGRHRISDSGLTGKILKFGVTVSRLAVGENVVINLVLVVLCYALVRRARRQVGRAWALAVAVGGAAALAISWTLLLAQVETRVPEHWRAMHGVAAILLFAVLTVTTALAVRDRGRRLGLFGVLASIVVLDMPLALVSPIGSRNFYITYLLFLVVGGLLASEWHQPPTARAPSRGRVGEVAGAVLAAALCAGYFAVYGVITHADNQRLATIRAGVAAGARTVHVNPAPLGDFVLMPNPTPGNWTHRFNAYYGLPHDLRIIVGNGHTP